jgi:uncharacterized protein with PQ loop repeat
VTTTEILGVAATLAGILMAISPVLQIRRMRKTGSSRDFSLLYASMLCVGFVLWLAYGWALGNPALIVSNLASLSFMVLTIGVALLLRRSRRPDAADTTPIETAPPNA